MQNGTWLIVNTEKQPETLWHIARETHQKALEAVCMYVEDVILNNNEILLTNDVTNEYRMLLAEIGKTRLDEIIYNTQKLEQKLLQQFQDRIVIIKGKTRRGNIIFSNLVSAEEALRKEHSTKTKLMVKLRDTAFLLREEIMATENKKLPKNLKIKDIFAGECKVPEMLQQFLKYVICGPDPRRNNSIIKNRRIESICQDVIFAATSGLKIPSKHLQVCLAMKSLMGSKKAVEILNRLGHSVSYNTVEELETELTFTATKENLLSPEGMSLSSDKATGLAFDNYDCFVETLSGKDTLHDTVGIAYQLVSDNADNCQLSVENENEIVTPGTKRKRRRAYESPAIEIEPYRKKTKNDA